jgi:hypothetical protein
MDSVEKIQDAQEKDEKNKKHQGKGSPDQKLQNKRHSTNK